MTFLRNLITYCESGQWPKTRWAETLVGWMLVLMGGTGLAGCGSPVNLAVFSIIPKAKVLIGQGTSGRIEAGEMGRVPFATRRKITFTVRNAGNIPAPILHFRVQSESSVDGPLFSVAPDSSCRDGMSLSQARSQNTCSLSVVFKAPVPQTLDELPPEGKLFQGQLTLDYDSGYTEADEKKSRWIHLDFNLTARVTAEPSFSLIESYVSDLPIGSNPSSFVTRDRVLFDSNSLASNTGVSVSNPDYDRTSIQIPVRFNGSLLPRSECQKFKESLSDFAFQGFSVQNQDCVKNDLIIPLLPGNPGLHGVPNQADQWIDCSVSMRTARSIEFNTDVTDWLSCNPTPSDMTSISAHLNPMEIFKEPGDEEYLTVKKLRSVISLVNNPSESTVLEVMAQAPKVSRPNWETVGSNIDIAELAITSSLTPSAPPDPPGYHVNPSLSWTPRLSSVAGNLSGLARLRAQLNRAEEYLIQWSGPRETSFNGSNCESGFDASSNLSTLSLPAPASGIYEINASQMSSALPSPMTWLPNHYYRACIRAVDAFGNRSTHALTDTRKSQDIPPLHFLPSLNLSQVNRSNQLTLNWVNDSQDADAAKTFGRLHHYQYRVLPQSGTPSCADRTDFTSVNATTIACSVNGAGDCTGTIDLPAESYPGRVCVLIQACNQDGNCIPSLHGEDEVSNARQSVSLVPPGPTIVISPSPSPRSRFDVSGQVEWFWSVQYQVKAYPSPSPLSSIQASSLEATAGMNSSALTFLSSHSLTTVNGTNCTTGYPNCKQFSGSFSDAYKPDAAGSHTVQYQSSPLTTFTITAPYPFELTAASINAENHLALSGSAMVAENLDHYEVNSWKKEGNSCAPPQGTLFTWSGPSSSASGPSPFPSVVPSFTSTSLSACSTYGIYCAQIKACDSATGAGKLCATRGPQSFFYEVTGNPVIRPSPSVSPSLAISPSPSPMVSTLADGSTRTFRVYTWNPKFEFDVPLSATVSSIDVRRKLDAQSYARIPSGQGTATYVAASLPTADTSCGRQIYRIGLQANGGAQTSVEVGIQPDDFNDHTVCYEIKGTYTLQGDATSHLASSEYCYTFRSAQNTPTVTWSPSPTPSSRFNRFGAIQRSWRIQGRILSNAQTLTLNDLRLKRTIQATTAGSTPSAWSSPLPGPSELPSCSDFVSSSSGPWCYALSLNETSASTSDEGSRAEASQKLDIPNSSSTEFLNDSNYQSITSSRMMRYRLEFPGSPIPSSSASWSMTIPAVSARFQLDSLSYDANLDAINLTATPMSADSLDHYKLESWLKPSSGSCSTSPASGSLHSWTSSTASLPSAVHFSNLSPNLASCSERVGQFCTRLKACNADDSVCASSSALTVTRTQNATAAPTITVTQSQPPTLESRVTNPQYRVLAWSWSSRATLISSGNLTQVTIERAHLSSSVAYPSDATVQQQSLRLVNSFSAAQLTGTTDCTGGRTVPSLSYNVNSPVENTYDLSSTYGWTAGADFAYHKICYKYTATNSAGSTSGWYCVPFHFDPPTWNGSASPTPTSTFNSQGLITWTWPVHGEIVGGSCSITRVPGFPGTLSRPGNLSGFTSTAIYLPLPGNNANDLVARGDWSVTSSTPGEQIQIELTVGGNPIVNFPSTLIAPSPSPFSVTNISYDADRDSIQFHGNKMSADNLSKYVVKIWKPSASSPTCTSSPGPSDTIASPLAIGTNSSLPLPTDVPIWAFFNYSEAPFNSPGTLLCANVAAADNSGVVYTAPITNTSFTRNGYVAIAPSNRPQNLQDWVFNWTSYFGDGLTTPASPDASSAIRHWEWSVPFRYESTNKLNQLRWKRLVQTRTSLEHDWNSARIPPDTDDSMWSAAGDNTLSSPAQEHPLNCGTPCEWNLYQTSIADSSQGLWEDIDSQPTYKRVCYQITAVSDSLLENQTYLCHTFQVGPKYQPTCTPTIYGSITYGASCNFVMRVSQPNSYSIDIAAGDGSCSNLFTRHHRNATRSATDTQYSFLNQEILGFAGSGFDVRNCFKIDACESKKDGSGTHCTHLPFTQF